MLFHAFWLIYTDKELDTQASKVNKNSLTKYLFAEYSSSGFVQVFSSVTSQFAEVQRKFLQYMGTSHGKV